MEFLESDDTLSVEDKLSSLSADLVSIGLFSSLSSRYSAQCALRCYKS